jgi:REP element-mobilizing transposase RayT
MSKSYSKIWVHAVWSTKNRMPLIYPKMEQKLFEFLKDELKKMGCMVSIVNGMPDHVHCLFGINPQKSITDIIKQIKGSSSYFVNSNNLISEKFIWQRGFGVFGVSHSAVDNVYYYIRNQKQHHKKRTFDNEYIKFMELHGKTVAKYSIFYSFI